MSAARALLERLSRLAIVVVSLATSLYAVLAHVPFTAVHFLEFRHFDLLTRFVELHPLLVALAWLPYVATAVPEIRAPERRARTLARLAATAGLSLALALATPLSAIAAGFPLGLAFLWLLPPTLVAVHDLRGPGRGGDPGNPEPPAGEPSSSIVATALATAVVAAAFYAGRAALADAPPDPWGFAATIAAHAIVILAPAFLAAALDGFGAALGLPARARLVFAGLPLVLVVERGVRLGGLASISFFGVPAATYATAFAIVLVLVLVGTAWRTAADPSPLRRLVAPIAPATLLGALVSLAAVGAVAHVAIGEIERIDWNDLGRRIVVALSWGLAFAILHRGVALASRREHTLLHLLALLPLGAHLALGAWMPDEAARTLARSAAADPSYSTASALLRPRSDSSAFYAFLKAHTNLPRTTAIRSPEVRLVAELATGRTTPAPHVFFVVVDSLRQDYIGAYEPRVDFTPAIDAFARDAVVFENAFTRYGATGLAEPSIWTGSMLPHLQYPRPFGPLNSLARLLEHERYHAYASLDTILAVILPPSLAVVDVDAARPEKDFDACGSFAGLEDALGASPAAPIFFYTQPQDLHVSVRHRQGDAPVDDRAYPGFDAAYASRVRRIDECFGRFVEGLRRRGILDESVIVLTSDHGDSLGEEGRWGHAYTLAPEVVRIPMIVRIPPRLRDAFAWDATELAFSTDLTPSLHRLLGHGPILPDRRFGRSLFRSREGGDRPRLRDAHLLASSYGAVWGILSGDGRELYVADAVAFEDSRHDLSSTFTGERRPVTEAEREVRQSRIRDEILAIERAYGIAAGAP